MSAVGAETHLGYGLCYRKCFIPGRRPCSTDHELQANTQTTFLSTGPSLPLLSFLASYSLFSVLDDDPSPLSPSLPLLFELHILWQTLAVPIFLCAQAVLDLATGLDDPSEY